MLRCDNICTPYFNRRLHFLLFPVVRSSFNPLCDELQEQPSYRREKQNGGSSQPNNPPFCSILFRFLSGNKGRNRNNRHIVCLFLSHGAGRSFGFFPGLVHKIIWTYAICMLMRRESMVKVVFPSSGVIVPAIRICSSGVSICCWENEVIADQVGQSFFQVYHPIFYFTASLYKAQSLKGGGPTSRKRKNRYPPNYIPPNAVAWCSYHEIHMNYSCIRKKRCVGRKKPCKHLHWYKSNHDDMKGAHT